MFRKKDPWLDELREVPVLSACNRRELEIVGRNADEVQLPAGAVLTREGAVGHECFILTEGEAVVTMRGRKIARLGRGAIIGEMAAIDNKPRSATVATTKPTRVLVMTNRQFAAIAEQCPSVARKVMRTLAQRLREVQAA
jgi:CRP-like cAMP-binding protein